MNKILILITHELIQRKRSFVLWILGWSLMSLLFSSLYESFQESFAEMNPFANLEDNPLFQAFGVSSDYFTNVEKYISGEFLISFVLMGGIFAAYLGADTLAGKIEDKTISNLLSKNLTRTQIYFSKLIALTIYIVATIVIIGIVTYVGFAIFTEQTSLSINFFLLTFAAAFLMQHLFICIGVTVGLYFNKGRAVLFGMSFLIFSWLLHSLAKIGDFPKIIEYLSPYYYIDFDQIAESSSVELMKIIIVVAVILLLIFIGWKAFRDKDIQV